MEQDREDTFELLDEQEPKATKRLARIGLEVVVGVLLLLAVAGWSGWDWWQQQGSMSNYRAGDRYAAARDWDAAHSAFLAAGDFGEAGTHAAVAATMIRDRDATYAAANAERAAGEWTAALRDFRHVQEIEPSFRDSAVLAQQVEQQVYRLALSGAVALRAPDTPAAQPPGLYLYLANGWNYLPGSDGASRVRSNSPSSCLVYDTPSSPEPREVPTPGQIAISAGVPADLGVLPGMRRLMVAQYGSGMLTARPLAFDPREFARFTCDNNGVKGASSAATDGGYLDLRLAYVRGIQRYTPAYQAYNTDTITRAPLPSPAWAILTDDSHTHLLIGDYTDVLGYHPQTRLYISDSQGQRLLAATRRAIVQAAWLSPEGRYLLVDEFVPQGVSPDEHRLVLLTSDQSRAPQVLMSTQRRDLLVVGDAWYDAAFIESGMFAGKLLIERKTYPNGELRLIDPADPTRPLWTSDQIDYVDHLRVWSLSSGLLLPLNSSTTTVLPALYVDAHGPTTSLALPLRYGDTLVAAQEINGRLVYVFQNPASGFSSVYSVPLPGTPTSDSSPRELVIAGSGPTDQGQNPAFTAATGGLWSLGPGLLAYVHDGHLEARTYDGAIALPLDESVLWFYPLRR